MALRGVGPGRRPHRALQRIGIPQWRALGFQSGVPEAFEALVALVERADAALETVGRDLPAGFPGRVWDRIAEGVRAQRARFLAGIVAGA